MLRPIIIILTLCPYLCLTLVNNNNRFITKSNDCSTSTAFSGLIDLTNSTRTVDLSAGSTTGNNYRSTFPGLYHHVTKSKYRAILLVLVSYAYNKIHLLLSQVQSSLRLKRLHLKQFGKGKFQQSRRQLSWNNEHSDDEELSKVDFLRSNLKSIKNSNSRSRWLQEVTDVELLRFLRAKHGNVDEALKMIQAHMTWRSSEYGADSDFIKTAFVNSPLRHEIFWLGLNKDNCPTMVIRTQVHDGIYYDEDPKIFVR